MAKQESEGQSSSKPPRPEKAETVVDIFVTNSVFPDAASVFTAKPLILEEAKDEACIVLDTNTLLVPYAIEPKTLAEVENTYRKLLSESRLLIPAQVAREFARNRVKKLVELHQKLSRRRSDIKTFQQGTYPLLEAIPKYARLREIEKKLDDSLKEYRDVLGSVIDQVASWEWNDPVSVLYSQLFHADVVVELAKPLDQVKQEHARRFQNQIPPGYKDSAKSDEGIGDLLIWLTILEIGSSRKKSVVFVSGEEKADWWHRSDNRQLYPRYELVDEFRRASDGHSFHIIKFSRLLELFGASSNVVEAVREEESLTTSAVPLTPHSEIHLRAIKSERAVASWLMQQGYKVSSASPREQRNRYDYLVEKAGESFAIDVIYARSPAVDRRLRDRAVFFRHIEGELPLIVVAVCESEEIAENAERSWTRLDPPFRLCTGTLTEEGVFRVIKGL